MSTEGGRWASGDVDSFWGIFGAIFLVRLGLGCRMGWGRLWGRVEGVDLHVLQRGWGDATITSWVNIFKTSSHSFQKTWKWERKEFDSEQIQLLCYLYKQLLNSVLIYFLFIFPLFCHTESEACWARECLLRFSTWHLNCFKRRCFFLLFLSIRDGLLTFHCWLYTLCIIVYVTNKSWTWTIKGKSGKTEPNWFWLYGQTFSKIK